MNLETLRHSISHILAYAVKELFPKAKLGIGPSIKDGFYYDFDNVDLSEDDLVKIENKMKELIKKSLEFERLSLSKKEARESLKNEPYKLELLEGLKDKKLSFYKCGNFIDLCKGPHIKNSKDIKAFKLLKIAGAYWKGDSDNKMLQRIYGTAFETEKELSEFLRLREEAEKRDHRVLGKKLDLFSFHEECPGFVFWHYRGTIIYNEIVNFWKNEHFKKGYVEVKTPIILNKDLWIKSGHWENYKENMYLTKFDDKDYAIKPMNCPGGILIYKEKIHSYKEFPLRVAELGLVHRHELSGVLSGLFRVRAFTQDDAHIYCTKEQIEDEVDKVIDLVIDMYKTFGFKEYEFEVSTKPEKYVGSDKEWDDATSVLKKVLKKRKIKFNIDEGAGVFYGPKIDIKIKDNLGRKWQCATIQLDFAMPERFDLSYEGSDGKRHKPIMIHRTVLGSLERFIGILIEHYAGKLPLWLNPVQVRILTVTDINLKFAKEVMEKLKENNIRVELDDRTETIAKKVRDAQVEYISKIITIGDKEVKDKTLAVRTLDGKVNFNVKVDSFIESILNEIKDKKC